MNRSSVVSAMVVVMVLAGCGREVDTRTAASDRQQPTTPTTVQRAATAPTTVPEPTTSTTTPPESSPSDAPDVGDVTLRRGDHGAAVQRLQERLIEHRFWLGTADATYGELTVQAVYALQKSAGLRVDGVAGPAVWSALDGSPAVAARSASGVVVEVDTSRQLVVLARDGEVRWILNTSTGTNEAYWIGGRREIADTPTGRFSVTRQVDGVDRGELGALYRPKYFHPDGIAVHGYASVPAVAASHGCVRVSNPAMDMIWRDQVAPIGSTVWVY